MAVKIVVQVLRAVGRHPCPFSSRYRCADFLNDLPNRLGAGIKINFAHGSNLQIGDSGDRFDSSIRIELGCPAPVLGAADITALYVAEFGSVPVGKRLFVKASTMVSGFESLARQFQARVPASV